MRVRPVEALSLLAPPVADRLDGEHRGVMRGADADRAAIGLQVVDAVGDGHAQCLGSEVMILDLDWLTVPAATRILEATHQLLFLGIDTDDGLVLTDKALSLTGDVLELAIPMRTAGAGEIFAVAAQCNTQLLQQPPYGVWADGQPGSAQGSGDLAQSPVRARATTPHGVARQRVAEQGSQLVQELRSFFSARARPPPAARIRSRCTSPASSCRRPRATVSGSRPSNPASSVSPP